MKIDFRALLRRNTKKLETEKVKIEKEIKQLNKSTKFQNENAFLQESEYESKVEDMELRDTNNSLKQNLIEYLGRIQSALANIRKRKYGKCERCGKIIMPERLKADPSAIYCLECAELMENNETA